MQRKLPNVLTHVMSPSPRQGDEVLVHSFKSIHVETQGCQTPTPKNTKEYNITVKLESNLTKKQVREKIETVNKECEL